MNQQFSEPAFLQKIGQQMMIARIEAGFRTQKSAAAAIPCDRTMLSRLEKGERNISIGDLARYAMFYGKELSFFVNFDLKDFVKQNAAGRS